MAKINYEEIPISNEVKELGITNYKTLLSVNKIFRENEELKCRIVEMQRTLRVKKISSCFELSEEMRGGERLIHFNNYFRTDFENKMYSLGCFEHENRCLKTDIYRLEKRIDKAIEYIKAPYDKRKLTLEEFSNFLTNWNKGLLEILKGDNK